MNSTNEIDKNDWIPFESKIELFKTLKEGHHLAETLNEWIEMGLDINMPFIGYKTLFQEALESEIITPENAFILALELVHLNINLDWNFNQNPVSALSLALSYKNPVFSNNLNKPYRSHQEKLILEILKRHPKLNIEECSVFEQPLFLAFKYYPKMICPLLEAGANPMFVDNEKRIIWPFLIYTSVYTYDTYDTYSSSEKKEIQLGLKAMLNHGLSLESLNLEGESLMNWLNEIAPEELKHILIEYQQENLQKIVPEVQFVKTKQKI